MSPPIMSIFDLFFIALDECDERMDLAIAQHIVNFHRFTAPEVEAPVVAQVDLSNYLRYARALQPKVSCFLF
jgi:DNA replication licensing factor MCM6